MIGILALILQIVMIVIIFSLPGRFREQREHMERQKREITDKLAEKRRRSTARSAKRLNNSPTKNVRPA